jgi:hypothetical protein
MQLMCQEEPYMDQVLAIKKRALAPYYGSDLLFWRSNLVHLHRAGT